MSSNNRENAQRRALITGITGQDGSYLLELLLEKDYEVHGIVRVCSLLNSQNADNLYSSFEEKGIQLHFGDITDGSRMVSILREIKPDEIYNLAAQSHVKLSFDLPEYTSEVNAIGVLKLLEAIETSGLSKTVRFYQASTSELYGDAAEVPQTEKTPFRPRSPYAISKLFSYWTVKNYREAKGLHASNGILFNHESPRRGVMFVTRKISLAVSSIVLGVQSCLYLGNLDAKRDWGHAKSYVHMMWLMLQQEEPDDYVIATGEMHTVREFVEKAFLVLGIKIKWEGKGYNEIGINSKNKKILVRVDPKYFRPTEVEVLKGCPEKARKKLGWKNEVAFDDLVEEMVLSDYKELKNKI